ncbi:MAG: hypothetical protein K0R38_2691 [Polyangiaceae bacterium]|nr:hypothetical protein [Polyangiaceae bacterium]
MTIRKVERDGKSRWVIDIPYKTANGKRERYRRDAQVQTKSGAEAEHRRLLVELAQTGTLAPSLNDTTADNDEPAAAYTFHDAVRHFRATHLKNGLKPSTRAGYENRIDVLLAPRRAGMLKAMPALPALPKVGRKVPRPMRRADLEAILAAANNEGRLAFALAAFAGLRASEVRGLRWSDVDLKVGTITVRRGVTLGVEVTPKSHHQRVVPVGRRLRTALQAAAPKKASPWAPVALTARGKPWGEFGLNQAFGRATERAKLEGWSFHDLRHFFVTELFRNGASAVAIQQLAGHADLATTQRYADLDADDLRSAIDRIDGNGVETPRGDDAVKQ